MVLAGFKKKLLIQVSIGLGAVLLLSIFMILLNMDINKQADAIEQIKMQLALRARTIELLTSSKGDVEKAGMLLTKMQKMLPTEADQISLPREMQRLGATYGVETEFGYIGAKQPATDQQLGSMKFRMSVIGAYDDIINFLSYFEAHQYIMPFEFVDLSRKGKDKDGEKFALMTDGTIYFQ
jgi:Tfp pilus assembly protein PilO